jgi:hypothetical protein
VTIPVKLLHLAAHVGQKLLGGVEPARRVFRGLDASLGQVEERCRRSLFSLDDRGAA